MLTYEDVIGLCEITEDEIRAIAEHEHLPEIIAAEMGNYLATTEAGVPVVKRFLLEDMRAAERRGDRQAALKYKAILKHFIDTHPKRGAPKG